MSNTTHKQQGAYQHLIYVHVQQQLCYFFSFLFFFLLHIKVLIMIFFSLSRKMLHICSFLWIDIKSSLLKYLVMCDLEAVLKWQISFSSDFITGDAKNFGRGLDITGSKTTWEMLVGLVCIPMSQDEVIQKASRKSRKSHLFAVSLSLVLISLWVKLLQCDCWTRRVFIALLGKGLCVSFEL